MSLDRNRQPADFQQRWIEGPSGWWKLNYRRDAKGSWTGLRFKLKEAAGSYSPSFDPEAFDYNDLLAGLQNVLEDISSFAIILEYNSTYEFGPAKLDPATIFEFLQLVRNPAPCLEHLKISGYARVKENFEEFDIGEVLLDAGKSGKLYGLKSLLLPFCDIDDSKMKSLAALIETGQCPSLSKVDLESNIFDSEGMSSLAASLHCLGSSLLHVNFEGNRKMGPAGHRALAQAMESGHLPALETLSLKKTDVGIYGARICEVYAKALSSGHLQALKLIDFSHCFLNDKGAEALASGFGSKEVKNMSVIRLHDNQIGNDGMIALTKSFEVGGLTNLRELNLTRNLFGEESVPALAQAIQSGNLPSLTTIGLWNIFASEVLPGMSEEQASVLLSAFLTDSAPKVTFVGFPWHRFPSLNAKYKQLVERNRMLTGETESRPIGIKNSDKAVENRSDGVLEESEIVCEGW